MKTLSTTTLTEGIATVLAMLRDHFDAKDSEVLDPLAERDADGLLALATLAVREVQGRCEGQ